VISELITAGSIREYIKKIGQPRIVVIKQWCLKILAGLDFLHKLDQLHGMLTCESIYINSNTGDLKIGEFGFSKISKHYQQKHTELEWSGISLREARTKEFDVYCFGLILLELISSPIQFKIICKLLNKGLTQEVVANLNNPALASLIAISLEPDPLKRATIAHLQEHQFFSDKENDHEVIKFTSELKNLIQKTRQELMTRKAERGRENKSFLKGNLISSF